MLYIESSSTFWFDIQKRILKNLYISFTSLCLFNKQPSKRLMWLRHQIWAQRKQNRHLSKLEVDFWPFVMNLKIPYLHGYVQLQGIVMCCVKHVSAKCRRCHLRCSLWVSTFVRYCMPLAHGKSPVPFRGLFLSTCICEGVSVLI